MLPIKKKLIKYNYSSGNNVKYIVIHDTGNTDRGANANAHYNYFNGGDRQSSAHYFVDGNNIIQIIEDWNKSWHCGDGGGMYGISNGNSIGIEICINSDGDYNKTISNTIDLVKYKMKQFGIPINKVVRHYDASRKKCPGSMSSNNWAKWNWFKSQLGSSVSSPNPSPSKPTAVVTASALNVREKKSTSSKILGVLPNNKSVEVYKVEGDWIHIYYPPHGGFISKKYVNLYNISDNIVQKLNKPIKKEEKKMDLILYFGSVDEYGANLLRDKLKLPVLSLADFKVNSNLKKNVGKIYMVGGSEKPISNTILISNGGRFDTAQAVVDYIKKIK